MCNDGQEDEKNSKLTKKALSFVPKTPITKYVYYCDNKFHVENLLDSLENEDVVNGFIIVSGDGTCMYT